MLWFVAHLVLVYVQRSDQLRMHSKTLQRGDTNGYIQNMTFFAGATETGRTDEKVVESVSVESPFSEGLFDWVKQDEVSADQILAQTSKSHRFNVAFGLSDYADSPDNVEDHLYGNLEAMRTFRKADGVLTYESVPTQPCTQSYIDSSFFPAVEYVKDQIEFNA